MPPIQDLLTRRNQLAKSLAISYQEDRDFHRIAVNDYSISFPTNVQGNGFVEPDHWIKSKHQGGKIHEPGMVAWLLAFRELVGDQRVVFFDVGALYGYFSILSQSIFPIANTVCVEANPRSCQAIREILSKLPELSGKITVKNTLLSKQTKGSSSHFMSGFSAIEKYSLKWFKLYLKERLNGLKAIARIEVEQISSQATVKVPEITLVELLDQVDCKQSTVIVKLDTEGFQAIYLPPAINELVRMNAVILMEFDSDRAMRRFNTTNFSLCEPFLDAGYQMFWCDHRVKDEQAIAVDRSNYLPSMETNSLAVLIPPNLLLSE